MTSLLLRAVRLLPLFALVALCASCNSFFVSDSSIQTVTINPTAVFLMAGASPADSYSALTSSALTAGGSSTTDTSSAAWSSSDNSIVTVSAGVLKAGSNTQSNQTATITAKDGGVVSNTCTVLTYTGSAPTSLSLVIPSNIIPASVASGTNFQLGASAAINGNSAFDITNYVTWTTSSSSMATVSPTGVVTVVGTGGFTIKATATLGAASSSGTIYVSQSFNGA